MNFDVNELLTLYEVASFSVPKSKETLIKEIIEKANRLLGVHKLALVDGDHQISKHWGFQDTATLWQEMKVTNEKAFFHPFAGGSHGYLYLEQQDPLTPQEKRLFTVFAKQIEKSLEYLNAEEKLKKSEKEKAAILDSISEHIVFQDNHHRILWCNRAAADSVDALPEQLVGRCCYEIWHGYEEPCEDCPVVKTNQTGLPQEGFVNSPDGRHWYIRAYPMRNEEGAVEGIVEATLDITASKELEEKLEVSQSIFKKVFNNVNDAIFIHEPDGNIIDVNETLLKMYELETIEEALGHSLLEDYSAPSSSAETLPQLWKKVMQGESQLFEWEARKPTLGSTFDVEIFLNKLDLGNREAILATVRDISAKKQEEALLRNLFAYSPIGMFVISEGRFLRVNSQFEKYTGYSMQELQEIAPLDLVAPQDRERVRSNAVEMLKGKRVVPYEFRLVNKWKEIRWGVGSITSISYRGEQAALGSVMDITERKAVEEQLKYLSFHDKLTGLYNRAYFEEELARLDTPRLFPLSVIIGDLNGLKLANDVFGHHTGDEVIIEMAEVLSRCCRKEDVVCRWGGDEYAILLPRTPRQTAEHICQRIKEECQKHKTISVPLDISLGTATKEKPEEDVWELINKAENRMYRQKLLDSKNIRSFMMNFLQNSLAEKTYETQQHVQRLEEYSVKMGRALELPIDDINKLVLLSSLHDVGKIAVPDSILCKPGKLTSEEWEVIKRHPEIGSRIVQSIPELSHIAEEILSHHEHWNGEGYPRGLSGEDIPLLARIVSVVDAYDAMVSERSYNKAIRKEEAITELKRCAGSQFDPALVDLFISIVEEDEET